MVLVWERELRHPDSSLGRVCVAPAASASVVVTERAELRLGGLAVAGRPVPLFCVACQCELEVVRCELKETKRG